MKMFVLLYLCVSSYVYGLNSLHSVHGAYKFRSGRHIILFFFYFHTTTNRQLKIQQK